MNPALPFTAPGATTIVTNHDTSCFDTPSSPYPSLLHLVVTFASWRLFGPRPDHARKKTYENLVVQPGQRCDAQLHAPSLDVSAESPHPRRTRGVADRRQRAAYERDRKSTRLNSSHVS